ncbi:chloride channel protein [Trypanosoma theileri]|uniref:Chloride channel protein n=1 Tax=Trypanosoma theileri TaxID=67003 RepID=A0A1X0NSH7_9TRYP|nr:chloride channel protein [Trypanosoma theileri]ORC87433.1 chloride channel protein [Trypanosoma theileri]
MANPSAPPLSSGMEGGVPSNQGRRRGSIFSSLRNIHRDRGTGAWFEELAEQVEEEGDAAFVRPRAPLFEKSARPHVFSSEERRRMDNYESIDYSEVQSLVYKAQMSQRKKGRRWLKWIMFIAVGICVGLWSVLLFQTLEFMANKKKGLLEQFINYQGNNNKTTTINTNSSSSSSSSSNTILGQNNLSTNELNWKSIGRGYGVYILWSVLAAMLSSLCCVVMPSAAGSGVPDVMAYLNGIMFPRIFNIRNLIIKTLSCILAVSSGLPVGAEGPIIHIGSLIGAGIPTGRSRTLHCSASSLLSSFRNPRDMRDFISAGAACGMTSAFSSPIGGMLFVMEEVATFFPVKLACLVFASCLSCMCVIQIVNTYLSGWQLSIHPSIPSGEFRPTAISMFTVDTIPGNRVPMNLLTFIPTVVGSIALGLLAVIYTVSSIKFTRWRSKQLVPRTPLRVLEPCLFVFLYATCCYFLPLAFNCVEVPKYVKDHKEELNFEFFTAFCTDQENTFNPLATLTLTSPYNGIRILLSRHTSSLIPWYTCLLQLILYTLGSSYAGGMFISCGTVIPSLFIGAIGGRFIGVIFGNNVWADPGVIALIGSASYFSGISRLSFSLIVIMMELTSDLTHITCLMVGVIIAKALADRCCHSLYHSLLEVKAVPFLEAQTSVHKLDMFCAKDIMTHPPITLKSIEKVTDVKELLKSTPHNNFPVISISKGTYEGVISRAQLELLLWFVYFRDVEGKKREIESERPYSSCGPTKSSSEYDDETQCGVMTPLDNDDFYSPIGDAFNSIKKNDSDNRETIQRLAQQQSHATYTDLKEVNEVIFWRRLPSLPSLELLPESISQSYIDLAPYVDLSAYYVRDVMCISRTYYIFRHLGLRQLPVVDRCNRVVGVITRKNFVGDRLHERLKEAEEVARRAASERARDLYKKYY